MMEQAFGLQGDTQKILQDHRALRISAMAEIFEIAAQQIMNISPGAAPTRANDACNKALTQFEEGRP